jgi:DNA ligase 1
MFKCMLAEKCVPEKLFKTNKSYLISPKLDGIRCISVNGVPQSRSGKVHRNLYIQEKFKELADFPYILDGELLNSEDGSGVTLSSFSANIDGIMTIKLNLPNLKYFIFDMIDENDLGAIDRYDKLEYLKSTGALPDWCIIVKKKEVFSFNDIQDITAEFSDLGYEGSMIQGTKTKYKNGRSTVKEEKLLKIKEASDAESIITGFIPLYTNNNELEKDELGYAKRSTAQDGLVALDMLGAFITETIQSGNIKGGETLKIGSGFTRAERISLWENRKELIGKKVTYKYFQHGMLNLPRCPIYKGIRDEEDL